MRGCGLSGNRNRRQLLGCSRRRHSCHNYREKPTSDKQSQIVITNSPFARICAPRVHPPIHKRRCIHVPGKRVTTRNDTENPESANNFGVRLEQLHVKGEK